MVNFKALIDTIIHPFNLFFSFARPGSELKDLLPEIQGKNALILAPHQDDETLGCGGMLLNRTLKSCHTAYLTDGSLSDSDLRISREMLIKLRKEEAMKIQRILNITSSIFLDFPDQKLGEYRTKLSENLETLIKDLKPHFVFTPFFADLHTDHIESTRAVLDLYLRENSTFFPVMYETCYLHFKRYFNTYIDYTGKAAEKLFCLLNYRSQSLDFRREIIKAGYKGLTECKKHRNIERFLLIKSRENAFGIQKIIDEPKTFERPGLLSPTPNCRISKYIFEECLARKRNIFRYSAPAV